jgi:hypothetical protein
MRRLLPLLVFAFVFTAAGFAAPVGAQPALLDAGAAPSACTTQNPAFVVDDISGVASPCATAPGTLLLEALYYQNASSVGGTALAAYPLLRLRTGIVHRLEAIVDLPSQIAESGLAGAGLYPTTHLGYGLNYTFATNARMAAAFGVEVLPPSSRFVVDQAQPRYVFDLTEGYELNSRATLSAIATGSSSRDVGFERIFPAAAVRFAYDSSPATQISTDLGMRFVVRHSNAQRYGDVAVNERVRKGVNFSVGLGTTFNPISNAKAHYLASGFNFSLK